VASLSKTLESFNRKERNLAVRHILGHVKKPPPLDADFCHEVCNKLHLDENKLAKAWWATDYHISWLAGALAIYARGDGAEERTWPNQPEPALRLSSRRPGKNKNPVERQIAEGNQEDIDLLIAVENHLILIEVKAYGSWDLVQLESKLTRIRLVKAFNEELEQEQSENRIIIHILLLSPSDLPHGKRERLKDTLGTPKLYVPWIKLCLPLLDDQIREVGRCDRRGHRRENVPSDDGSRWGIYNLRKKRLRLKSATPSPDACFNEARWGRSIGNVQL
jgi:hypothetical protein